MYCVEVSSSSSRLDYWQEKQKVFKTQSSFATLHSQSYIWKKIGENYGVIFVDDILCPVVA